MTIQGTCAMCGMPGHRYGTTDPEHDYNAVACINSLKPALLAQKSLIEEQEGNEALIAKLEKNCNRLLVHMGWKNNCIECAEEYPFAYPCSAHDEMFQRLLGGLTARAALERIAYHDGDRWDWDRWAESDKSRTNLRRQPSPQEIAQEALAAPPEGDE